MRTELKAEDFRQFVSAGAHHGTRHVLDVLESELKETRKANDTLTDIDLYRSQGKALFIDELLQIFKHASEYAASSDAGEISAKPAAFY